MIIIEGTIGAGKSTLLSLLRAQTADYHVATEPLESWDNYTTGTSLLQRFYEDPYRWAFTMEKMTLLSRVREVVALQRHHGNHVIMERSIFSGRYCFAYNSYKSGFMNEIEWQCYQQWFDYFMTHYTLMPRAIVYLRVDPHTALERIKKRNRASEKNISLDYLTKLGELHDQLLRGDRTNTPFAQVPILELDGTAVRLNAITSFIKDLL